LIYTYIYYLEFNLGAASMFVMEMERDVLLSIDARALAEAGEHASRLNTRLRYRVYYVEKCSSTQDLARELAEGGAAEGTVVVAEEQERGRGRLGRSWFSGKGGLWFTVILRPGQRLVNLLSLAVGVSVARVLRGIGLPARLKWPNDVVIEGKKVGGILVEAFSGSGEEITALVGIGLNVNNDLPEELAETSASLKGILGRKLPKATSLDAFIEGGRRRVYIACGGSGETGYRRVEKFL
jgi:BirA family biotin operon repressor/biotin-[acetyl-CoA-carboxylase] ligase